MALSNAWCALAALLCSVVFVTADSSMIMEIIEIREECMKELGINETDIDDSGVSGEKMLACMLRKDGTITPEGKFSDEKIIAFFKIIIKDDEARQKSEATVKECGVEINSAPRTEEEVAVKLIECLGKLDIPLAQVSMAQDILEARNTCMTELNIDEKDPEASGVSGEKLMACVMKKGGSITPEGTFSGEQILTIIKFVIADENALEKATSTVAECEKEINSETRTEEQIALMAMKCLGDMDIQLA